ncbi:tRNA-dihydrouridine synthase [Candidatus Saccharibacteria bacterium]|nr:tRNA-dihydrouridine synthase [Candidatus Saccharibacteria bacterium]MCB9821043.1 tRNA-dihydrouridine synthase [Candidatus Nomurabacteria bacterium]
MLILAPMYDVTDTTFRQVVAACAPPDMFFTEFVNVEGLQSAGRPRLEHFLKLEDTGVPVVAQIWGKNPDNYYQTAKELAELGFAGIDINTGCPDKTIVKNGCCSAFIKQENRENFAQILAATKHGVKDSGSNIPVSVKTRLGFNETDFGWHEFLLKLGVDMLTIHGRTRKEMSKVPVRWDEIEHIRKLRDAVAPQTKIIGNGDVSGRAEALELQARYGLDGIMIGRGIFTNPYFFAENAEDIWASKTSADKIALYIKHLELYRSNYPNGERKFDPVKKFMKVYLSGFDGASELRAQIANIHSCEQAIEILRNSLE